MKQTLIVAALVALSATTGCQSTSTSSAPTTETSTSGAGKPGGWSKASVSDANVRKAAQVAVDTASKAAGKPFTLVSVDAAEQQVVAGMNYSLKLTVKVAGKTRSADATVWWQSWRPVPFELTSWDLH